jgi:tRNA (guanine-N7-)-methyltransferase
MATALPSLALDLGNPSPVDAAALFSHSPTRVVMEIGFGGAEHLVSEAKRAPDAGFIGVEPFVNGLAKAVTAIDGQGLANVRLFGNDAALLLDWLPPQSLDQIDLLYPDPWPKKRHWKRRFVSGENLDRIARALKPGGIFRFASDIPSYVEWTLMHVTRDARFAWTAEKAADWTKPYPDWPGTRYEAKALREGRVPTYLEFTRLENDAAPLR